MNKRSFAHVTKTHWFYWAPTLRKYIAFYARCAIGLYTNIGGFMPPERGNASMFSGGCTKSDGLPGVSVLLLHKPLILQHHRNCKLNGIEPFAYLCDILEKLPTWPNKRLYELLPWNWKKPY